MKTTIAPAPHQWTVILEYSKGVITLAAALLSATVAFSGKILGEGHTLASRWMVFTWLMLLATIVFGLLAAASLSNHLAEIEASGDTGGASATGGDGAAAGGEPAEAATPAAGGGRVEAAATAPVPGAGATERKRRGNNWWCIMYANLAFFALAMSAVGFLVLGLLQTRPPPRDRSHATVVRKTIAFLDSVRPIGRWMAESWYSLPPDTFVVTLTTGSDTTFAYLRSSDDAVVKLVDRQ